MHHVGQSHPPPVHAEEVLRPAAFQPKTKNLIGREGAEKSFNGIAQAGCIAALSDWPPALPEALRDWPKPKRARTTPARWLGTATEYRTFFQRLLNENGEEALAEVYNGAPRRAGAYATRWFCPDLPMLATGQQAVVGGKCVHIYLLPARAALLALDAGLVKCRKDKGEPSETSST